MLPSPHPRIGLALALLLTVSLVAPSASAAPFDGDDDCGATLWVPQDHPTISAAVEAANPGDRIRVSAGVYAEQVIIDKAIQLEGSGAEDTIIDGQNSLDLAGMGQIRVIAAGDVEISNLGIVHAGRPGLLSEPAVGIFAASPVAGVTYHIHDNQILDIGDPNADPATNPDLGIGWGWGFHSQGGLEHLRFEDNEVARCSSTCLWLEDHAGPTTIRENDISTGLQASNGIFLNNYSSTPITTPQKIRGNTIDMGLENPDIIGFPAGIGIWAQGARYTNVRVQDNRIENVIEMKRGILLFGGDWPEDGPSPGAGLRARVEENEIIGAPSSNGFTGYGGITVWGACWQVRIEENEIREINDGPLPAFPTINGGIRLRASFLDGVSSPVGTIIRDNRIDAQRGISVEGSTSNSQIRRNRITALGPAAVELGPDTSGNSVKRNRLETPTDEGNAAVIDNGVGNTVRWNR